MRAAGLLLLAAALPAGCIQGEQSFSLFPDGSGKVVVHVGIKKQVLTMIEEMAKSFGGKTPDGQPLENPFTGFHDPKKLARDSVSLQFATASGAAPLVSMLAYVARPAAASGLSMTTLLFSSRTSPPWVQMYSRALHTPPS